MEEQSDLNRRRLSVHILPQASHDLADIVDHIAIDSLNAAHRMRERIMARIDQIAEHPGRGKPAQIPGLEERGIRFAGEGKYHIYYRADEQELLVFHVFHSARNITALHFSFKEKQKKEEEKI